MRYIKLFESELKPRLFNYVICEEEHNLDSDPKIRRTDKMFDDFLQTSVGQIIDISEWRDEYYVQYEDVPPILKDYFLFTPPKSKLTENIRRMAKYEIIHHSKDKEKLKAMVALKKYNL